MHAVVLCIELVFSLFILLQGGYRMQDSVTS